METQSINMDALEGLIKTHRQIFCHNEDIGHLFVPNINARIIHETGGYYVKTNSLGFRSNIEFKEKKDNKKRILFFGDSNTAADGVSNNERFSDLVGKHFESEVYNFALPGSGTDQQYLIWKKYAQKIEADLIVIGVLVENIERNKVAFRETLHPYTKKRLLTPKPYFEINKEKLELKNTPVPKNKIKINDVDPKKVQWVIPKNQEFLYKAVSLFRESKILKPVRDNFSPLIKKLRSTLINLAYQPYPDYKNSHSPGYNLMKRIISDFTGSINSIPTIIMPIPTYHYYFDGAKPIYRNFFNYFNDPKKNIYVLDILDDLKKLNFKEKQLLSFRNDKSHFSQFGHKTITNSLVKKIEEINVLPKSKIVKEKKINNVVEKKPIYILGISAFYHDSAASLIKDGEIIAAAQEERFSRKKNDRRFPMSSINFCLEKAGIQQNDLSAIVYYDNTSLTLERLFYSLSSTAPKSNDAWLRVMPSWIKYKFFLPQLIRKKLKYSGKIIHNLHHRSHIASAFFPSPFKKAAILTIDGVGEWATASIGVGEENKITMLKEMHFPDSIGLLYSAFTQFTGFKVNSGEYKMMGLAPYGKPKYVDLIEKELINIKNDGSIKINQKYFSYIEGSLMTNKNFSDLFNGPARIPETEITQREMDIACSIQKVTEKIILKMARYVKELTKAEYLCLSGGVALNCVANGYLLKENLFKDIWIQPASGDAGSSLGCAFDAYFNYFEKKRNINDDGKSIQLGSLWGPEWNTDEIKSFLNNESITHHIVDQTKRSSLIANFLNEGKVIGHFSGRTEFGPRALGARSIIGDSRNKQMQTNMNIKIKKRESFRPFAPAILIEKVNDFFELEKKSPHMMLVSPVKESRRTKFNKPNTENMLEIVRIPRSDIPAVTHVDYSARIQTIEREDHKKFYDLIKAFDELTGYPVIVNTSFNVRGEPIVNSPYDAYQCFMNTEMDILFLEDFLIKKTDQINNKKFESNRKNLFSETINKDDKSLQNQLKKIYKENITQISKKISNFSSFNINANTSCWVNSSNKNNEKNMFIIPANLDEEKFEPKKMAKSITNFWHNSNFAEVFEPILVKLISLSKKYPLEEDVNSEVSEKIYEMF